MATKEESHRLHYFTYAAYKPLQRMLSAQILSGIVPAIALAMPLIIRYAVISNSYAIFNIINGAVCIVLFAICLGIVTRGKKLFEILFFLLTYTLTQKIPVADYLGGMSHDRPMAYIVVICGLNVLFASISFAVRNYQLRHV